MTGGKRIVRADVKPGMIVEHRVRFLVSSRLYGPESRKHAGRRKYIPLGDVEEVVIGERWSVRRKNLLVLWGAGVAPYWVAQGGERDEDGRPEWCTFDTFAEAIAYADKRAREVEP